MENGKTGLAEKARTYAEELSQGGRIVSVVVSGPGGVLEYYNRLDGSTLSAAASGSPAEVGELCRRINDHVALIRDAAQTLAKVADRAVEGLAERLAKQRAAKQDPNKAS